MKPKDRGEIRRENVKAVLRHYFDGKPKRVEQVHGGLENVVFEAELDGRGLIVRMSAKATHLPIFMKEQWAVRKARDVGVPVAVILEVGNEVDGFPYMICEKVEGQPGTEAVDRMKTLRELAGYARKINSVKTGDFGNVFDWSRNRLSRKRTWVDYLENELEIERRLEVFRKRRIFTGAKLREFRQQVEKLKRLKGKPCLNHGDIRLKNVLLDERGEIKAIIDWENCTSNLAPYWELSLALHDLNIDEKQAFVEAYGMNAEQFAEAAPLMKTLNVLNYCAAVETVRQAEELRWIKARLNGALDLYSFA